MAGLRLVGFLFAASAALLQAQDCSSGPRFLNANTLAALGGSGIVAFGREDNLPYFTSTLTRFAPYRASLPQVDGNQLLEGCFAANPPLVAPPASYQSGAGSQRAAVIHSADNSNVGFAMLFYSQQNAVKVWKLNADLTIAAPQTYSFGNSLNSVLAADLNADGIPDLAVVGQADQSNSALWILVNNGDLTFKAPVPYTIPGLANSAAVGDFNGDGKPDLAVGSGTTSGTSVGSVTIFFGNGDGSFRNAATYSAGSNADAVAVADLDGDGVADIVVGDNFKSSVGWLPGNSNGTFRAFASLFPAGGVNYVAVGDFNNDGHADIAWTDFTGDKIGVALGTGGGKFGTPQHYAGPSGISSLIVTDVNQDGHVDLVSGLGTPEAIGPDVDSEEIVVLMNNGDGTFQGAPLYDFSSNPNYVAVADFDGDGKLDVAGGATDGTRFNVVFGAGAGAFGAPVPFLVSQSASGVHSIAAADFDGDGRPDLLLGSAYGTAVSLALYRTGREFQVGTFNLGNGAQSVAAGDFNGDSKMDAAVALGPSFNQTTTPQGIAVLPGNGKGGFGAPILTNGITSSFLAPADFNKDGKLDLAAAVTPVFSSSGQTYPGLKILTGKGDGTFNIGQTLFDTYQVMTITAADVNADGIPDVLASLYHNGYTVGVALGNGDGTFQTPVLIRTDYGAQSIAVVDLDGDGKVDLAVAHCCSATTLTYMIGNGDGTFQAEKILAGESYDIHAADLNGDGNPDLLFTVSTNSSVEVLLSFPPSQGVIANVNGASFLGGPLSSESIASAFGNGLATDFVIPGISPLPQNVKGTTVMVTDSTGTARPAGMFFVSDMQVNYEIPAGTANGTAKVTIVSPLGTSVGAVEIGKISPAFFEANAALGLPVAATTLYTPDLTPTPGVVVQLDSNNNVVASPIDLGTPDDKVYLTLYATGVRNETDLSRVSATIGGLPAEVQYAGPQGGFVGLDQVNLLIPHALAGKGQVDILLTVDGVQAPPVVIVIK